ncbi:unnamed protein product, partial [Closterium sp. Naga37s-1]
ADNKGKTKNVVTKADVEEASTNVHVRAELIRTMRDVLSKKTTEAVRELKTTAREPGSKPTKSARNVNGEESTESDLERYKSIFGDGQLLSGEEKSRHGKFGSFIGVPAQRRNDQRVLELNLDDAVANAISKISENSSLFLKRDELCYNLSSFTSGNLESTISRVLDWHGNDDGYPEISIPTYFDLSPYKGLVVPIEEDLLDDEAAEDDAPIEVPSLFDGQAASDTSFPSMEPDVHGEALHCDAPAGEDKEFDDICDLDDFDLVDKLVEEHEAKKAARAAENANLREE